MTIIVKAIKPQKMKVDAFRLEFLTAVHKAERGIKKTFKTTTETWEHKPKFESIISLIGGPSVFVGTDDEIYGYVDKGTRSHRIVPKRKGYPLRFKSRYRAKSIPNVLGSRKGGASGDTVRAMAVNHPGTKARNFDKMVQKLWTPRFKRLMEEAMRKAVQKSGHSAA